MFKKISTVLVLSLLLILGSCAEDGEELENMTINVNRFSAMEVHGNNYLFVFIELENLNEDSIKMDRYFRLKTPIGIESEDKNYPIEDACYQLYDTEIEGNVSCRAVFKIKSTGDFVFDVRKTSGPLNSESVSELEFKIDENLNITN